MFLLKLYLHKVLGEDTKYTQQNQELHVFYLYKIKLYFRVHLSKTRTPLKKI